MENITLMRRYFHMYPEMSTQEFETTKKIASILSEMNIPYEIPEDKRGLVAHIKGRKKNPIAIVCDIDALPIDEKTDLKFKSRTKNRMHACGHDANIAIVLDFLNMIKNEKNLADIYAVFQSDEEIARGALKMKKFSNWYEKTDAFLKLHVNSLIEKNKFMIKEGNLLTGAEYFKKKGNTLKGRIKYFDKNQLEEKKSDLSKIIKDIGFSTIVKPVINDGYLSKIAFFTLNKLGFENSATDLNGGDDFSFYIENKRGLYLFFGVQKDGKILYHHADNFDIEDLHLKNASIFLKEFVENYSKLV